MRGILKKDVKEISMPFLKKIENLVIIACMVIFFAALYFYNLFHSHEDFPLSPESSFEIPFINKHQDKLTLDQFKGVPLIVNFWATWCPVCVQKMGTLNIFAKDFKEKGGQIISLSEDQGMGVVKAYFARNNYQNLEIYMDPGGNLMHSFGATGLPTSIFFDANGNELERISGGIDWNSPIVLEKVRKYFNITI